MPFKIMTIKPITVARVVVMNVIITDAGISFPLYKKDAMYNQNTKAEKIVNFSINEKVLPANSLLSTVLFF
ncbi:hypothetical protein ACT7T0_004620, partial [Vibrio parahaemolyticus]